MGGGMYIYKHKKERGRISSSEMGIFHDVSEQTRPLFDHVITPEIVKPMRDARAIFCEENVAYLPPFAEDIDFLIDP